MVKYGIGSLQPKHEVFAQHNEEIQEALAGSTMNSDKCTNWWKMDRTGRNTVSNSLSAGELWRDIADGSRSVVGYPYDALG
jgi:hypothetical protein